MICKYRSSAVDASCHSSFFACHQNPQGRQSPESHNPYPRSFVHSVKLFQEMKKLC
jgi:hypothetical protein